MGLRDSIRNFFARPQAASHASVDEEFFVGVSPNSFRDRADWNFQTVIENSLQAWRENPLARRIVNLQTQYVIGDGIQIKCDDPVLFDFIMRFWNHPLNHMDIRVAEWCDELTRTGNLFILISTDLTGMSYVRAIPATAVKNIETAKNDYEQGMYYEYQENDELEILKVYAEDRINPTTEARILHFAVNRPVGGKWGEPDLAPVLPWLSRYSGWLEDRARLNHYRNSFLFVVNTKLNTEAARKARQDQLNSRPLSPGSILVTTDAEQWDVLSAKLESNEAEADGLAIKKQIASGVGIPLYFLAEPESQNKASAEAAGGATYRTFEQRQKIFLYFIHEVLETIVRRRRLLDHDLPFSEISLIGADISGKDNTELSTSAATMSNVATQLRKLGYISKNEFIRLVYKFGGEIPDSEEILRAGGADPLSETEKLNLWHIENNAEEDPTKYNTTTIDGPVPHYDQGAEVN